MLQLNQMQSLNIRHLFGKGCANCTLRVRKTEPGKLEIRLNEPGYPAVAAEFSEMKLRQLLKGSDILQVNGVTLDSHSCQSGRTVYIRLRQGRDVYTAKRDLLIDTIFHGDI